MIKNIVSFVLSNWKNLSWMLIALLFIAQLSGIKKELKRVSYMMGNNGVFLMEEMEKQFKKDGY